MYNQGKTAFIQNLIETVFNFLNLAINKNINNIKRSYLFDLLNNNKEKFIINDFTIKNKEKLISEQDSLINKIDNYKRKFTIFFHFELLKNSETNTEKQQELFISNTNEAIEAKNVLEENTTPESVKTDGNYPKNETSSNFKGSETGKNSEKEKPTTILELIYLSTNPKIPSIFREGAKKNIKYYLNEESLQKILSNFDLFKSKTYKYQFSVTRVPDRLTVALTDESF